ncbi:MAG: recombinase family protein [Methanobacterium sp.]|nr:recombinase family protein [Methanobacterium sp.]
MVRRIYGYTRVSTDQQKLDRGIADIKTFAKSKNYELKEIITDKQTGRNFERVNYQRLKKDLLRDGDILIVPEMDRLGRDKSLLHKELEYYKENNIRVIILDIPTTQSEIVEKDDDPVSKLVRELLQNILIEVYTTFAQVEVDTKKKRQEEGMRQKALRVQLNTDKWDFGRELKMSEEEFKKYYDKVLNREMRRKDVLEQLGISSATYHKYVNCIKSGKSFSNKNPEKWLPVEETKQNV